MSKRTSDQSRLFVAIDANSLIHRAFHAFPPDLATSDGIQVNAVYGFTSMLLRVLAELDPKYLVCAFDLKEPTFRHAEFVEYKGTRKPTDHTLTEQFPLVKEVLTAFNVPILEHKGFEADDILATLAEYVRSGKWNDGSLKLIIVTGDKDLLQVAGDTVGIWLPRGSFKDMELYGEEEVKKRFGFGPEFIPDFKGLVGDPSDNIPGVKGIGEKSGTDFIKAFGHLEELYKNLEKVKEKQRKLLVEGEESAVMSRHLATVVRTVSLDVRLEECLMKDFDRNTVIKIFQKFEFRSLLGKIPQSMNDPRSIAQMGMFAGRSEPIGGTPEIKIKTKPAKIDTIEYFFKKIHQSKSAVMAAFENGSVMAGLLNGAEKTQYSYYYGSAITDPNLWKELIKILLDGKITLTTYGWESLWRLGITLCSYEEKKRVCEKCKASTTDVGLMAYQSSSGQKNYTLKSLAFVYAGMIIPEEVELLKSHTVNCIDAIASIAKALGEHKAGPVPAMGLPAIMHAEPIRRNTWKRIDVPMSIICADMSSTGIAVDIKGLEKKRTKLKRKISEVAQMIYESIGHEFNVNSNKQLADVLFEELGLPVQRRRKTGPSTDEGVLVKLKGIHPCIEDILIYREWMKMLNTYVEPLIDLSNKSKDGRIHSTFHQTGTSTGRLSSDSPNLQTIPIRSELGREIRDVFVAGKDAVLISIDYSQIDLRVMAAFSRDQNMIDDFKRGVDFHSATAARIFGKDESTVTGSERRIAKTINFGVLYGMSPFGLSEALHLDRSDAAEYIQSYFRKYAGVQRYLEETIKNARESGFVETALGRRRYISGLRSDNRMVRAASEREAINMPIQGTSADIMRVAMVDIYEHMIEKYANNARLVLQIHDEFLIECKRFLTEKIASELKEIMVNAMTLRVPLECKVETGSSLAAMEELA